MEGAAPADESGLRSQRNLHPLVSFRRLSGASDTMWMGGPTSRWYERIERMCKGPPSTQPAGLPGGTSGQEHCQCRRPQNMVQPRAGEDLLEEEKATRPRVLAGDRMDRGARRASQGCKRLRHNGSSLAAATPSCRRPPLPRSFPSLHKNI